MKRTVRISTRRFDETVLVLNDDIFEEEKNLLIENLTKLLDDTHPQIRKVILEHLFYGVDSVARADIEVATNGRLYELLYTNWQSIVRNFRGIENLMPYRHFSSLRDKTLRSVGRRIYQHLVSYNDIICNEYDYCRRREHIGFYIVIEIISRVFNNYVASLVSVNDCIKVLDAMCGCKLEVL